MYPKSDGCLSLSSALEPETREVVMQIVTSWMEEGIQQGFQQGYEEEDRS